MDGGLDSIVGPAPADIANHGAFDRRIVRLRIALQEGRRAHHLPALAITALRNAHFHPGFLNLFADRVIPDSFDGRDALPDCLGDCRDAGSNGLAIQVHRTRAAQTHAAAEFRPGKPKRITNRP